MGPFLRAVLRQLLLNCLSLILIVALFQACFAPTVKPVAAPAPVLIAAPREIAGRLPDTEKFESIRDGFDPAIYSASP
jgi:hypothetical protein